MNENIARVYALVVNGIITRIEGEISLPNDLEGWTLIEEGTSCDRLNHAQNNYLEKGLMTEDGIYQYKYINGEVVERTEEEIEADRLNVPTEEPTQLDRIESQVLFTALMTDTLLEG